MYKLIEWIRLLTFPGYTVVNESTQIIMENVNVNRKRHAKYFLLCLELLPPRLASHDSTRFVYNTNLLYRFACDNGTN